MSDDKDQSGQDNNQTGDHDNDQDNDQGSDNKDQKNDQKNDQGQDNANKGGDHGQDSKAKEPERVVPDKYDLALPKGSPLAPESVEKVAAFAKENGLTNDEAQAVLERESASIAAYVEGQQKQLEAERGNWIKAIEADKEIGGEAFKQNAETAKRVIERFGSKEFKEALNQTGLGDHPELVRTFVRIGKQMTEDQLVMPGAKGGGKVPLEDKFYPSHGKSA